MKRPILLVLALLLCAALTGCAKHEPIPPETAPQEPLPSITQTEPPETEPVETEPLETETPETVPPAVPTSDIQLEEDCLYFVRNYKMGVAVLLQNGQIVNRGELITVYRGGRLAKWDPSLRNQGLLMTSIDESGGSAYRYYDMDSGLSFSLEEIGDDPHIEADFFCFWNPAPHHDSTTPDWLYFNRFTGAAVSEGEFQRLTQEMEAVDIIYDRPELPLKAVGEQDNKQLQTPFGIQDYPCTLGDSNTWSISYNSISIGGNTYYIGYHDHWTSVGTIVPKYDLLDEAGNLILSDLDFISEPICLDAQGKVDHVPCIQAQKGFTYGLMDLDGRWVWCESVFEASCDEPVLESGFY